MAGPLSPPAAHAACEQQRRLAAEQERLRVAREIHDVVGHGLTVISMQAAIALHLIDSHPDQAGVALATIRTISKAALEELRATLAVFHHADAAAGARPPAGLDRLEVLVSTLRTGGLAVRMDVTGKPRPVPAPVGLAAYRIVQESLTNVLRHAGRASAAVKVRYAPDAVVLDIADDGRGVPPTSGHGNGNGHGGLNGNGHGGHGIRGMRERAAALGGTLQAGPRPEGGFRVHAHLPSCEQEGEGQHGHPDHLVRS